MLESPPSGDDHQDEGDLLCYMRASARRRRDDGARNRRSITEQRDNVVLLEELARAGPTNGDSPGNDRGDLPGSRGNLIVPTHVNISYGTLVPCG